MRHRNADFQVAAGDPGFCERIMKSKVSHATQADSHLAAHAESKGFQEHVTEDLGFQKNHAGQSRSTWMGEGAEHEGLVATEHIREGP